MEKYTSYQTFFTWAGIILQVLALLCGGAVYHYNSKREQLAEKTSQSAKNDTALNNTIVNNIYGDLINGQKINNTKKEILNQPKKVTVINPNALIVTENQSGGQNIINYNAEKFNPANISNKPIFEPEGNYGQNILCEDVQLLKQAIPYSLSAKIPVNTTLKVNIEMIGEDKKPKWGIKISSKKNWRYNTYDNSLKFIQQFELEDEFGELNIIFNESGEAIIKIYFNDEMIGEKRIKWN